jgi:hypothetical protein
LSGGAKWAADLGQLEAHAPYLRYDAQDGYRAVSAATMTDAPCNCLGRADGSPIAGQGTLQPLSLETLARYPAPARFEPGDRLASGPSPLMEAVRMQSSPEYPHCAYGRVVRRAQSTWLEYWLWYYDNPKTFLGQGRHEGDWELVIVELDGDGTPKSVTCSQHNAGEARKWDAVEKRDGHPVVYVAPFSHANYFEPRTYFYFPGADHPTAVGPPPLLPQVVEFGPWQQWKGRWGSTLGLFGGRLNIGGTSPEAPISQRQRWFYPARYHRLAALRKPVAWFWKLLWHFGKATFPPSPRLTDPKLDGTCLTVTCAPAGSGLRRGQHLLLTAHENDEAEAMLISCTIGAEEGGRIELQLPRQVDDCVVYASAFNALHQRSDPVRATTRG